MQYTPKPIHAVQATPADGFTADMIPEENREKLYKALATAADNFLRQEGLNWFERKAIEGFYVDGKIKKALGL